MFKSNFLGIPDLNLKNPWRELKIRVTAKTNHKNTRASIAINPYPLIIKNCIGILPICKYIACVHVHVMCVCMSYNGVCKYVCPSKQAREGAVPISSLQSIPSGSKLIGPAMFRLLL